MVLFKSRDKKIAEIGRYFGEKSDFGGPGKDFAVEKSGKKNRRKIADFSDKNRFISEKNRFFLEFFFFLFFS